MEAYSLIILELLDLLTARSVKLAILDRALQRTGSKLRGMTMRGFYKNLFIQATSDVMGLKFFPLFFPNGLIGYVYGPISARENDNGALNGSELNQHMMDLQVEVTLARERGEQVLYFSFYGDAIFPILHCITRRHRAPIGGQLTAQQIAEDTGMSQI